MFHTAATFEDKAFLYISNYCYFSTLAYTIARNFRFNKILETSGKKKNSKSHQILKEQSENEN